MDLPFQLIADLPGSTRLEDTFARHWPSYQNWINRSSVTSFADCLAQFQEHVPELLPTFESLHVRFGETEEVGRFLTLYNPPRVVRACTQLMVETDEGPTLLRSYDHDPRLLDAIILRSNWDDTSSLVVTDCLWGALDGINEHGLAIALAFGGRNVIGSGFAAPLICRYILQTCATVDDAREALARLPVYMPYTFAVLDATGDFVTAFLGPDADAIFVKRRTSTNHQGQVDWPEYARFVETTERLALVEGLTDDHGSITQARRAFLTPPVWRTHYTKGSGTLYVAEYSPTKKTLDLHWPGQTETFSLDDDEKDRAFTAVLPESVIT